MAKKKNAYMPLAEMAKMPMKKGGKGKKGRGKGKGCK